MLEKIKKALSACPEDGVIYLVYKLSAFSGFFMSDKHLIYMVYNTEEISHQSLTTEFLRLDTDIEINSIKNNQQFESGRYNIIEILPTGQKYDEENLNTFVNICIAHTNSMESSSFLNFFYSLVNLFQYPKEQKFVNLIGLFGELSFLSNISKVMNVDLSNYWHTSGSLDKYDIALKTCNLEIKTTASSDESVTIKHFQLFNKENNFLVTILIEENNGGITLNQLIADMQMHPNHFKSLNFALNIEREKKRISSIDAETKKFCFKSATIYNANLINPFQKIPENISDITYKLDLFGLPSVDLTTLEREIKKV